MTTCFFPQFIQNNDTLLINKHLKVFKNHAVLKFRVIENRIGHFIERYF